MKKEYNKHIKINLFGIKINIKKKSDNNLLRNQMMNPLYPITDSSLIKPSDKVLVIAPHPDDEVIGCGGIIAKYHNQIDVLCINSSGVKYEWNTESEEEIAQIRCDEFYKTMTAAKVNKAWIAQICGIPPMFKQINSNFNNYLNNFNFKEYDLIFVPHEFDGHREHRFVGNHFVKRLLNKSGYKKSLKIVRYEIWGTMVNPNYYEDITDFVNKKTELINTYESRKKAHYAERILGLNYYRGIIPFFNKSEKYAEAFYIQSIKDYLKEKDDRSWSEPR